MIEGGVGGLRILLFSHLPIKMGKSVSKYM